MTARFGFSLAAAAAAAVIVSSAPAGSADARVVTVADGATGSCGEPGQAPCPLQGFMRLQVAAPLAQKDLTTLAASLDRAATLLPDATWTTWPAFAKAGADAARSGKIDEVRKACKGCHDTWRAKYRKDFRPRPLP